MARFSQNNLLISLLSLLACGESGESGAAVSHVEGKAYNVQDVEATAFKHSESYELRLLAMLDPKEGYVDDEIFVRVDARILVPIANLEYAFFGMVELPPGDLFQVLSIEEALPCSVAGGEEQWLQSDVEQVCLDVYRLGLERALPVRERVGGVLRIDQADEQRLHGHLTVWATGLDASGQRLEALQYDPLFSPGVTLDTDFDVKVTR